MSCPPQSIPLTTNIQKCFLDYNERLIHQLPCGFSSILYSIKDKQMLSYLWIFWPGGERLMVSWETNFTNFLDPAHNLHHGLQPTWKWLPAKPKLIPTNVGGLTLQQVRKARKMWQPRKLFTKKNMGLNWNRFVFDKTCFVQTPKLADWRWSLIIVSFGKKTYVGGYPPYWFGSFGCCELVVVVRASWPNNGIMDQRPSEGATSLLPAVLGRKQ